MGEVNDVVSGLNKIGDTAITLWSHLWRFDARASANKLGLIVLQEPCADAATLKDALEHALRLADGDGCFVVAAHLCAALEALKN